MKFSYKKHYREHAEGHIYFDVSEGPCTIHLLGAASMSQDQLDQLGELIVKLLNGHARPKEYNLLGG